MFGRATIRLGIGPHSSLFYFVVACQQSRAMQSAVSFLCSSVNL